jgi:hypothetical protein
MRLYAGAKRMAPYLMDALLPAVRAGESVRSCCTLQSAGYCCLVVVVVVVVVLLLLCRACVRLSVFGC